MEVIGCDKRLGSDTALCWQPSNTTGGESERRGERGHGSEREVTGLRDYKRCHRSIEGIQYIFNIKLSRVKLKAQVLHRDVFYLATDDLVQHRTAQKKTSPFGSYNFTIKHKDGRAWIIIMWLNKDYICKTLTGHFNE